MALSADQRRLKDLEAVLRAAPKTEAQRSLFKKALDEYDALLERIAKAETAEHGAELAAKMRRDALMRNVAAIQTKAGKTIGDAYEYESRRLGAALLAAHPSEVGYLVQAAIVAAGKKRDDVIVAALDHLGAILAAEDRRIVIQTFGKAGQGLATVLGSGIKKKVVEEVWDGGDDALKYYLWAADKADAAEMTGAVKQLLHLGRDARRSFAELEAAGMPPAKVSGWVARIASLSRDAGRGVPGAKAKLDAAMAQARAYVLDRTGPPLGTRGAGRRYLAGIKRALREHDQTAVNSAVNKWVRGKSRYQAITGMRTATNMTYEQINVEAWKKKPFIYAVRWVLSLSHSHRDWCDLAALANPLGLGPGVYIIGRTPDRHISCLCRLEPLIDRQYLTAGKVPLGFAKPGNYDAIVDKVGASGKLGREFSTARAQEWTDAEIRKKLGDAGVVRADPVALVRRSGVNPDNTLK